MLKTDFPLDNIADSHLRNLIRRCREELQLNHPVQAHMWLSDIAKHMAEPDIRSDQGPRPKQ